MPRYTCHTEPVSEPYAWRDEYWTSKSRWFSPKLDVEAVASILELQDGTVRQYVARGVADFPDPMARGGGKNLWSPDQIFRFIDRERPQSRDRIPRLYAPSRINPAVFLSAERITVGPASAEARVEFAIHHWQPSDIRGPIAVAYPDPRAGEASWRFAPQLLKQLPTASAVIVVTNEVAPLPKSQGWQAALAVVETGRPALTALGIRGWHTGAVELGWYDLANLLRQDIPWWSKSLRDINEIIHWAPGTPRKPIRPRTALYDESMLRSLSAHVAECDQPRVTDLADRINRQFETNINDELPIGENTECPGLLQAATPAYRIPDLPDLPAEDEIAWLLTRSVPDLRAAETAATLLQNTPVIEPFVANIITIQLNQAGPLAHEFFKNCRPVAEPTTHELGFAILRRQLARTERISSYCKHRHKDRYMWIIETNTGAVYATVGTKVPAIGQLQELELAEFSAFFRDSHGVVWPIPAPSLNCYYSSGHEGNGPADLYRVINALRANAACDVSADPAREPRETRSKLWRHIVETPPPMTLSKHQLAALTEQPITAADRP